MKQKALVHFKSAYSKVLHCSFDALCSIIYLTECIDKTSENISIYVLIVLFGSSVNLPGCTVVAGPVQRRVAVAVC